MVFKLCVLMLWTNVASAFEGLNRFFPPLITFANPADAKYILPEMSSDEQNIKHFKGAILAGCKLLPVYIKNIIS